MKIKVPVRKRGRKPKPRSDAEESLQSLDAAIAPKRVHLPAKARAFITHFVDAGQRDPVSSARAVGYARPERAQRLVSTFRDLIAAESLRARMGQQMELDEALRGVAEVARDPDDPKTRLAALRTVLEVQGVLGSSSKTPGDRANLAKQIELLVAGLRKKANGGGKAANIRVRARETTEIEVVEDQEISENPNEQAILVVPKAE